MLPQPSLLRWVRWKPGAARLLQSLAHWRRGQRGLVVDTVVLGVAGALGAQVFGVVFRVCQRVFLTGIAGYQPPQLVSDGGALERLGPHGLWLVPVATTLGGLLVGIITVWLAPEAEGHGTDAVIRAFHRDAGRLRTRVAPVKLVASAITIGSGGSAGREGPIALIAAGIGSAFASFSGRSPSERRLLLLVGMSAGLSASFRSPIGAALLAVEVLYADMEFEASALLYATLAAIVAYALNGFIDGWAPLFRMPASLTLSRPSDYLWYGILGVAAGLLATLMPVVFFRTRDAFRAMRVPPALKPAIGGLLTGLVALIAPQIIGGGYGWMQLAIDGQLSLTVLLAVMLAKVVATSLTVSSGGSGGVFAPTLFIGSMLGGACAAAGGLPSAPLVVVGMAAVFAGAGRVPFATMMMVTEMTGGYTLLVPAALAVTLSYLVQTRLSRGLKYRSLYEAQVGSRAESPAHHSRHVEIALQLLRDTGPGNATHIGELDLVRLMESGIPVDLGDDRRLRLGVLTESSAFIGKSVGEAGRALGGTRSNIIAILRDDDVLVPRADVRFACGDRVIVVADGPSDVMGAVQHW